MHVCPNEGLIGTLGACCETCRTILTPDVCECPESVAERYNGFGQVLEGQIGLNSIGTCILEVCVSPESATDRCIGLESQEFNTVLSSIGTRILKVCECTKSVLGFSKTKHAISCHVLKEEINLHIFWNLRS